MGALEVLNVLLTAVETRFAVRFQPCNPQIPNLFFQQRLYHALIPVVVTDLLCCLVVFLALYAAKCTPFLLWSHELPRWWLQLVACGGFFALAMAYLLTRLVMMPFGGGTHRFQSRNLSIHGNGGAAVDNLETVSTTLTLNSSWNRLQRDGKMQFLVSLGVKALLNFLRMPQTLLLVGFLTLYSYCFKQLMVFVTHFESHTLQKSLLVMTLVSATWNCVVLLACEPSLFDQPFAFDRKQALVNALKRDCVRALRRSVVTLVVGNWLLVLLVGGEEFGRVFAFGVRIMLFLVVTGFLEHFTWFAVTSAFRLAVFQPDFVMYEDANQWFEQWVAGNRVDASNGLAIEDLVKIQKNSAKSGAAKLLTEQNVAFLNQRVNNAMKKLMSKDFKASTSVFTTEKMTELLDELFAFQNVANGCRFKHNLRKRLYDSQEQWQQYCDASTGVLDGFALCLKLFLATFERRNQQSNATEAIALEKSVAKVYECAKEAALKDALLVLERNPSLCNVTISSKQFPTTWWWPFFLVRRIQFALRSFIVEETKQRLFARSPVVRACVEALAQFTSASRSEDSQGNVKHTIPAIFTSLVECRRTIGCYIDTFVPLGNDQDDQFVGEAWMLRNALDKALYRLTTVFFLEMDSFEFPPSVALYLQRYVNFDA